MFKVTEFMLSILLTQVELQQLVFALGEALTDKETQQFIKQTENLGTIRCHFSLLINSFSPSLVLGNSIAGLLVQRELWELLQISSNSN